MVLLIAGLFVSTAVADEINLGDRIPEADEVVEALAPAGAESETPEGYKSRAIRPKQTAVSKPRAISMEITFQKNSYRLSDKAQQVLDVVGKSLSTDRLKEYRFVIEGHTDASGSDQYNLRLSGQRAAEVKRYLVQKHYVDPSRLTTVGKGESDLLVRDDPYAARNRRVKIVNIGN